jgi:hypothetical protein
VAVQALNAAFRAWVLRLRPTVDAPLVVTPHYLENGWPRAVLPAPPVANPLTSRVVARVPPGSRDHRQVTLHGPSRRSRVELGQFPLERAPATVMKTVDRALAPTHPVGDLPGREPDHVA